MMDSLSSINPAPSAAKGEASPRTDRDTQMRERAKEFEAAFIAQVLKHGGLAKAIASDSGHGGEAFSSLMSEEYAGRIADQGGFGLADKIYSQLRTAEQSNGQ